MWYCLHGPTFNHFSRTLTCDGLTDNSLHCARITSHLNKYHCYQNLHGDYNPSAHKLYSKVLRQNDTGYLQEKLSKLALVLTSDINCTQFSVSVSTKD